MQRTFVDVTDSVSRGGGNCSVADLKRSVRGCSPQSWFISYYHFIMLRYDRRV